MHPGALSTLALEERTTTLESTVPSSLAETVTSLDEKRALAEGQKGLEPSAGCKLSVLTACSMIVSVTQGWGLVFGVFQPWFRAHLLKAGMSDALLVLLPAIQVTAYMMTCTLSGRVADRFGHKPYIVLGSFFFVMSNVGCAFDSHFDHVYATQVFQGVGAGLVYPSCLAIATKSWASRRQFVNSVMMIGIPIYGSLAVMLSRVMLSFLDHQFTLLVFAGLHFLLLFASLVPVSMAPPPKRLPAIIWIERAIITQGRFWCLAASVALATFALVPPVVFIALYTNKSFPLISPQLSVVPLAVLIISSAFGRTLAVLFVDRIGARTTLVYILSLAAFSQGIWALARSRFPLLILYACINGATGSTFLMVLPSLSGSLFPTANKTSLAGSIILFTVPGSFLGPFIFDKVLLATRMSWEQSIMCLASFQMASASFVLFCH